MAVGFLSVDQATEGSEIQEACEAVAWPSVALVRTRPLSNCVINCTQPREAMGLHFEMHQS